MSQGLAALRATAATGVLAHVTVVVPRLGFPGGSAGEESACNAGGLCSIPGLGRSPGREHSNPLQYFCLENPMDRGDWWDTVHGVTKSQT